MPATIPVAQLEERIGLKSQTNSNTDRDGLIARLRLPDTKDALRNNLRLWLNEHGLLLKQTSSMANDVLAKCYTIQAYLKTVRHNKNPSWDLINMDEPEAALPSGDVGYDEPEYDAPKPEATATASVAVAQSLSPQERDRILALAAEEADKIVSDRMANLGLSEKTKASIREVAAAAARDEIINNTVKKIEITDKATGKVIPVGLQHAMFPKLLQCVQARDHRGFHLNIWLTGPTGSGKTTAGEAVSKALSLPFGSDGSLDADYKVLGFRDANGHIVSTQFLDIYENGGIYIADEIDVWMPSALLSLNAALANGWCSSPKGLVQRHKDCCVIACANTWGFGATTDYVGRAKLDAASLDRFHPKLNWVYDEKLERTIAVNFGGDVGAKWCDLVVSARHAAQRQGLKIIISPRATFNGIALLQQSMSPEDVADMTFCAGISPEQKQALGLTFTQMAQVA